MGDVKNLYDVFNLGEVLLKLKRVMRQARNLSRCTTVAVQMIGGNRVHFGAAVESSDKKQFVNVTLGQICRILQLDLRCVCRRGRRVLVQLRGIAMGKPPSPAVAIMTLATDEAPFHASQLPRWKRHQVEMDCSRYMDDLSIRIGF